jgi:hypothetical protein
MNHGHSLVSGGNRGRAVTAAELGAPIRIDYQTAVDGWRVDDMRVVPVPLTWALTRKARAGRPGIVVDHKNTPVAGLSRGSLMGRVGIEPTTLRCCERFRAPAAAR